MSSSRRRQQRIRQKLGSNGRPKLSTLVDTFDSQLDTARWSTIDTVGWQNGAATITATAGYSTMGSLTMFDARDSVLLAQVRPANGGGANYQADMRLRLDSANYATMRVINSAIRILLSSNDIETIVTSIAYNPTAHAWWRIRDTNDTSFHFDTSPDGIHWTNLTSTTHGWSAGSVTVVFQSGRWGTSSDAVTLIDNIGQSGVYSAPATPVFTSTSTVNPTPVISGRAEPYAAVTLTVGSQEYTTRVAADGTWLVHVATALTAGQNYSVTAQARNDGGYTSPVATMQLTVTAPQLTTIVFNANYAVDEFSNYIHIQPDSTPPNITVRGLDYDLSPDPAGTARTVAWYDNSRGLLVNDVTKPRCEGITPSLMVGGNEYWHSFSFYLPAIVGMSETDWCTLTSPAYGPPYNGPSPLGIGLDYNTSAGYRFRMADLNPYKIPFQPDSWVQCIQHFRFATDGWVETWYNNGPGPNDWQRLDFGGTYRAQLQTMKTGVNDGGANYAGIGTYGTKSFRLYVGTHMITQGGLGGISFTDFGQWDHTLPGL